MADSNTILKRIKTRLRNRQGEVNLSHLMKIALSPQQTLSDKLTESQEEELLSNVNFYSCSDLLMIEFFQITVN